MLCAHSLFNRKYFIVALYPFIRSTFYIYAHRAWIFMLIYFMDAKTTQRMNNLIFKLCVCFVIPCEMHIYLNISFHSTLFTAKLIQISVFVTLHHIEIYGVFLFLFSFSLRSVRLLLPLCCSPIAWIVIWRTYNAFILIHCHHRHHHHHPAMDEIFNSNGITLSLLWFWFISFGGYHKWSNFPAISIKIFSFNIRTILWFYTV